MGLVTLKTYETYLDAHLIKVKLESEGIRCFLQDENMVTLFPTNNNLFGGIKLQVDSSNYEKAEAIILQIEST